MQLCDASTDRFESVADLDGARRSRQNGRADRGGIFAAWIIVGHDHAVRFGGGNGTHQRSFAAVAIAAGAQNNDQMSGSVRTQSIERLGQGVRLMRVINKNLRATAFANAFEPSFGAIEVFKRCEYRVCTIARRDGEPGCEHRILGLEFANQRQAQPIEFGLIFKS
jgi:hypothetical protein